MFLVEILSLRMQTQSRTKGLLLTVVSLLFIWGLFYISSLLLKTSKDSNLEYIPSNAEISIRIDGKKMIKNTTYDLLVTSKDQQALDKIMNFITKESENADQKKLGINFLSQIGIFVQPSKQGKLLGVLVNLNEASQFEENGKQLISPSSTIVHNNNVGLILTYLSPNDMISQEELQKIGNEILATKGKNPFENTTNKNLLIEIKSNDSNYGKGKIEISEINNEFIIESNLNASKTIPNNSTYCLKPNGLHVSCAMIPDSYLAAFEQLFPISNKDKLPKIKNISWNYQGMNIQEGGSHNLGFFVQPMTDMLIEFEKPFHLNQHIDFTENFKKWGIQTNLKGLTIGNQNYIVDSLSPTTFFIGINSDNLIKKKNPYLLNIEGDINTLLKISGSESITTFVDMIFPAFATSQDFFKTIENTSIQVKQNGDNINIKGKLKFKKGKFSYTECLRFVLALKGY